MVTSATSRASVAPVHARSAAPHAYTPSFTPPRVACSSVDAAYPAGIVVMVVGTPGVHAPSRASAAPAPSSSPTISPRPGPADDAFHPPSAEPTTVPTDAAPPDASAKKTAGPPIGPLESVPTVADMNDPLHDDAYGSRARSAASAGHPLTTTSSRVAVGATLRPSGKLVVKTTAPAAPSTSRYVFAVRTSATATGWTALSARETLIASNAPKSASSPSQATGCPSPTRASPPFASVAHASPTRTASGPTDERSVAPAPSTSE